MRFWLILSLVITCSLAGLLTGCNIVGGDSDSSDTIGNATVPAPNLVATPDTTPDAAPLYDEGIVPGKVNVSVNNYYDGVSKSYSLALRNNYPTGRVYYVFYKQPIRVTAGYVTAPIEAENWVSFDKQYVPVQSFGVAGVEVTLTLPKIPNMPDKWEFWIGMTEATNVGNIKTEVCSKWLVDIND